MTKFNPTPLKTNVVRTTSQNSSVASSDINKDWMSNGGVQKNQSKVSANEVISLSALIAYVANNSGENEYRVERRLSDRFSIPNVMCLPAVQFDSAILYLTDGIPH